MRVWTGSGYINILREFPYSARVVRVASGNCCMEFRSEAITSAMEWIGPFVETKRLLNRAVKLLFVDLSAGTEAVDFTDLMKKAGIELEAEDTSIRASLEGIYGTEAEIAAIMKQEEVETQELAAKQVLAGGATEAT